MSALVLLLVTSAWALAGGARAESATPAIAIEGWYARNKVDNPKVDTCPPAPLPAPPGCGPVIPADVPAPQSVDSGAYVTSTAGGDAGRSDASGDTGWAVFQWDLLSYLDATVSDFTVVLTKAPDNRGDFGTPVFSACAIIAPFGATPGPNPWSERPQVDFSKCVVPTALDGDRHEFDVTELAQGWVDGESFGMAIVPGTPERQDNLAPFQYTFAGYATRAENAAEVVPKVTFEYTPGLDGGFSGGGFSGGRFDSFDSGTSFGGGFDSGPIDDFSADPGIDVFPDDIGSEPLLEDAGTDEPVAAAPGVRRVVPAGQSSDPGFPLAGWLLLPLGLAVFLGAGTALGEAGEPAAPRVGGVSRVLSQRRGAATDATTSSLGKG